MPAALADSPLYARLFGDAETARLFTDSAELRAMMLVEGALTAASAKVGLITRAKAVNKVRKWDMGLTIKLGGPLILRLDEPNPGFSRQSARAWPVRAPVRPDIGLG